MMIKKYLFKFSVPGQRLWCLRKALKIYDEYAETMYVCIVSS